MLFLTVFLLSLLVSSFWVSYYVAAGNLSLERLASTRQRMDAVSVELSKAELRHQAAQGLRALSGRVPAGDNVEPFCALRGAAGLVRYRTTEEYQLCTRATALAAEDAVVRQRLREWFQVFARIAYVEPAPEEGYREATEFQQRVMEERAVIFAAVIQTTMLPLMYGVLGAGVALVRRLRERMAASLLSPQDATLALIQLALGGTMGICIGFFVNPPDATPAASHGLPGGWTLSSTALSFLAGFGLEAVFRSLEGFVHRMFNTDEHMPRPPGHGKGG